jgi:hypothetical protein
VFLYSELTKQELITAISEKLNQDEQFIVKEIDINSHDITNIRNWVDKVIIKNTPKQQKNPVEIMYNFVNEVEQELEKQLKEMESGGSE